MCVSELKLPCSVLPIAKPVSVRQQQNLHIKSGYYVFISKHNTYCALPVAKDALTSCNCINELRNVKTEPANHVSRTSRRCRARAVTHRAASVLLT